MAVGKPRSVGVSVCGTHMCGVHTLQGDKKDKRRASIHDITTDHVVPVAELAGMPWDNAGMPSHM